MKTIPLTQGKVALVDDADFDWLSQWKWYCANNGNGNVTKLYAARRQIIDGRKQTYYMHRMIMNHPMRYDIDHIDGNCLNNQRENLRVCTRSENMMNQSKSHRFDRFKGVGFHKVRKMWRAYIKKDGKAIHLGFFDYSTDAAIAYNEAAKKLFGEFARLNQIPE